MSSSPDAGRRLGDYHLVHRIAVGGMAEVFEARRGDEPRPLVLKILLPQFRLDSELIKMFEDEARLTRTLNHPNLVQVLDYGEASGERFMVMEYVDGPTLSQLMKHLGRSGRTLPVPLVLYLVSSLLQGLHYIHGRADDEGSSLEIVHRDVTPGNVLLSRSGEVKLGDFGIARHKLRSERTRTGVIKGTVQYMAPEQITGVDIDQRTDIYGVGLILFEMLTGQPYIQGEREVEMLTLAQDPPWRAPSSVRPDLDAELDRLLRPALARFSEERYPNAQSFLSALEKARASIEKGAKGAEEDAQNVLQTLVKEIVQSNEELAHGLTISTFDTSASTAPQAPPTGGSPATEGPPGGGHRRWLLVIPTTLIILTAWFILRPTPTLVNTARPDAALETPSSGASPADARLEPRPDMVASVDVLPRPKTRSVGRPRVRPKTPVKKRADAAVRRPDAKVARSAAHLRPHLDRALAALAGRGILIEDLPRALRVRVVHARTQVRTGLDTPGLARELQQLELALGAVPVDRKLVELKLKRVDQGLTRAKKRGLKVQPLRDRSSVALQAYMDGRYGAANRHLNAIISALKRQSR